MKKKNFSGIFLSILRQERKGSTPSSYIHHLHIRFFFFFFFFLLMPCGIYPRVNGIHESSDILSPFRRARMASIPETVPSFLFSLLSRSSSSGYYSRSSAPPTNKMVAFPSQVCFFFSSSFDAAKKRRRRRREKEPPEKEMNILLTYNRSSTERNQLRKNGRDGQESGTRSISQNNLHSTQSPVLYDVHQAIGRSYERSEGSEKKEKEKKMPFYYYIVSLSFGQLDQSSVAFTCVAVYRG